MRAYIYIYQGNGGRLTFLGQVNKNEVFNIKLKIKIKP